MKTIKLCLLLFCLSYLLGCGQVDLTNPLDSDRSIASKSNLAETATPSVIQELALQLEQYNPQVKIISPQKAQIFNRSDISVRLEVRDLPIFQDDKLKLGNHLELILDNEPAQPIYDATEPVLLENLTPGNHTLRVLAARPWGESYKNEGAYAQTTFSVLTETNDNRPDFNLPLLTYSNPTGTYGAEPILLDFYLTNAPLHSIAQQDPNIQDWRIKVTVNGESFLLENWQPVYLTGFNQGENWIQLELIDEAGNNISNVYNNTVRVIDYDPEQIDTLGKLVSDRLSPEEAQPIVEQTYYIQPVGEPEIIEPSIETEEILEPTVTEKSKTLTPGVAKPTVAETTENQSEIPRSEISSQPQVIPITETEPAKEDESAIVPRVEDSLTAIDATKQTIATAEENADSSTPIATIEIPQPESVKIIEDEIAITIPSAETETKVQPEAEITTESPVWWKKILVGLRQKLEGLVKLLPNEV